MMSSRPRVAVVTHNVDSAGGTRTLASFLCRIITDSGRYIPEIVSLATSSADSASVLLSRPRTWLRGPAAEAGCWRGIPTRHVGAVAGELEFQRYRPRRVLTDLLQEFDLLQFAVGAPPWAGVAEDVDTPTLLWTASTTRADRENRLTESTGARGVWSRMMTHAVETLERRALQRVDTVLALSRYTERSVGPHVEPERLVLAPCGVDTDLFRPGVEVSPSYVLGVARFHDPRKNLPLLLRAYARLRRSMPAAPPLFLVGETPSDTAIQMVESLGLTSHVRFSGVLTRTELVEVFRAARLFVLSSDEEGLGIPVIEAMASGVPVVSTACGGPETAITHGETGLLTPVGDEEAFADAMHRVLADPHLHARMRAAGRRTAETRFSLEATGRVFLERYDQALGWAGDAGTVVQAGRKKIPVSVVVPFFDGHGTIGRAIRSVERQTLLPMEIVVVDDGSVVPLRIEELISSVPLRVIRCEENRGIPAARNRGIREAGEEWVAFLDHDDEWLPQKLERQWALTRRISASDPVAIYGRCIWLEPDERKVEAFPGPSAVEALSSGGPRAVRLLLECGLSVPFITILAHRGMFERFGYLDEGVTGGSDDYELVLRWASQGVSFVTSDFDSEGQFSAIYHMAQRNYSRHPWFVEDELAFFRGLAEQHPELRAAVRIASARTHYRAGRIFDRQGERRRAAREYSRSLRLNWRELRPWAAFLTLPLYPKVRKGLIGRLQQVRHPWRASELRRLVAGFRRIGSGAGPAADGESGASLTQRSR